MNSRNRSMFLILFILIHAGFVYGYHELGYQYLYPGPNADHVYKGTTLIIRFENVSPADLTNLSSLVSVTDQSGRIGHGTTKIASDSKTIIFTPDQAFQEGETVLVSLMPTLRMGSEVTLKPITYTFTVASLIIPEIPEFEKEPDDLMFRKSESNRNPVKKQAMTMPNGVSVPGDFPHVEITVNDSPDDEYIFIDNRGANMGQGPGRPYNVIFDNTGSPVWYWQVPDERRDFKVQPNGWATMMIRDGYGGGGWGFIALDNHYDYIKTFRATNGYYTDEHELQVLADGGYLIIGRLDDNVDMSQYVDGGQQNAWVITTCVQEYTAADELIFEWSAWDHFNIREIQLSDPRSSRLYFAHINSIDIDEDDNLIISSRELSEVCKIDRHTGDFIWRLGGAHNQFTWVNDDELQGFRNQHTARVLGDNVYSIFDNGNLHNPPVSRAVKYRLDLNKMTATLVWQYINTSGTYSYNMGNAQQLLNGNMLINWARTNQPKLTEVCPDGSKAFEMNFMDGYECYRVHRCAWNGMAEVPRLEYEVYPENITLIFNKFGDPDVAYYRIYGGSGPNPTALIDTSRVSMKIITNLTTGQYWFRVTAVGTDGQESGYSNEESFYVHLVRPGENMVENGDFSQGTESWTLKRKNNAKAEWNADNGEACILIEDGKFNEESVQLVQNIISLVVGGNYTFEFDARADAPRIIEAKVEQSQQPKINYSKSTFFNFIPSMEHFIWEFEMEDPTDYNAQIVFNMGNSEADVYLDNISLKQKVTQWAFGDSNRTIPGLIQCEEYDYGGEGIAYHDDQYRNGDADFRPGDKVDIENTSDEGNGYNICWVYPGEWFEYTVNAESGLYDIEYRTASESGEGRLEILLDNRQLCRFNVPSTGGWQSWTTLVQSGIWITGGNNLVLKLYLSKGNQNLNWIRFIKTADDSIIIPEEYYLFQNMPNPFNKETRIEFGLPVYNHISIQVFNMLGKRIRTLINQKQEAGSHHVIWDGTNSSGIDQPSGMYLVRMKSGNFHAVRKILMLK